VPVNSEAVTRLKGGMLRFWHRLAERPHLFRDESLNGGEDPGIVAVTADLRFYSCILNAACASGWTAEWAPSVSRGLEVCRTRTIRIVIYDKDLPFLDWRDGVRRMSKTASPSRILLASTRIDEELWRTVLRLRGYDVLARSSNSEQLSRELRFASLSLTRL
jgi:DNA-binding response OmpR family regulator